MKPAFILHYNTYYKYIHYIALASSTVAMAFQKSAPSPSDPGSQGKGTQPISILSRRGLGQAEAETGRARWIRAVGPTDQVFGWYKPYVKPVWMTAEEYAALPLTPMVRECRYRVTQAGLPGPVDHPGHDAARRRGLPRGRACRVVPPTMGGRDRSGPSEDHSRHGRASLRDGERRPQGTYCLCDRLQPGSGGHARGQSMAERAACQDELRGCPVLAVLFTTRHAATRVGRPFTSPGLGGATLQKAVR